MKSSKEKFNEAQAFLDESLIARAQIRATGASVHNVNCWIGRYRGYTEVEKCADPIRAKWYRDVLMIFANGSAPTIEEAEDLHYQRTIKKKSK